MSKTSKVVNMTILEALLQATKSISDSYFLLPIAGRNHPIKRERVYCYELYHQLRIVLDCAPLMLMGEPDKRGHPTFVNKINPDFILHIPGAHIKNETVIEVECRVDYQHLCKDFKNFRIMKDQGYKEMILLLVGNNSVPWSTLQRAASAEKLDLNDVTVVLHRESNKVATCEPPPTTTAE
jgi:hypothetical protein